MRNSMGQGIGSNLTIWCSSDVLLAAEYACISIVRDDIDRMNRKMLGLLVLGIALVPFASRAMTIYSRAARQPE